MKKPGEASALIFNIQPFSLQDGPGIRTTVFFKGCNLACYWCHNPESLRFRPEIMFYENNCIGCGACLPVCPHGTGGGTARFTEACAGCGACARECFADALQISGYEISLSDMIQQLSQDISVYQASGGGVTFSGGEPLMQGAFVREALSALKGLGVHTAMESAVCVPWKTLESVLPYIDLMYCDVKQMDDMRHRAATGASNAQILENIRRMSGAGVKLHLRTPIIPGFNDALSDMDTLARFVRSLSGAHPVELMPFHGLCVGKYQALNRTYAAESLCEPDAAHMNELAERLRANGVSAAHRA